MLFTSGIHVLPIKSNHNPYFQELNLGRSDNKHVHSKSNIQPVSVFINIYWIKRIKQLTVELTVEHTYSSTYVICCNLMVSFSHLGIRGNKA